MSAGRRTVLVTKPPRPIPTSDTTARAAFGHDRCPAGAFRLCVVIEDLFEDRHRSATVAEGVMQ